MADYHSRQRSIPPGGSIPPRGSIPRDHQSRVISTYRAPQQHYTPPPVYQGKGTKQNPIPYTTLRVVARQTLQEKMRWLNGEIVYCQQIGMEPGGLIAELESLEELLRSYW